MSMRVHKLTTYLRAEDAYTIIEFLDQLRDMLMLTYGDEIRIMLQEASQPALQQQELWADDAEPF